MSVTSANRTTNMRVLRSATGQTYSAAANACASIVNGSQSYTLAASLSAADETQIQTLAAAAGTPACTAGVLLGLRKSPNNAFTIWADGVNTLTYNNWVSAPDTTTANQCAVMSMTADATLKKWGIKTCTQSAAVDSGNVKCIACAPLIETSVASTTATEALAANQSVYNDTTIGMTQDQLKTKCNDHGKSLATIKTWTINQDVQNKGWAKGCTQVTVGANEKSGAWRWDDATTLDSQNMIGNSTNNVHQKCLQMSTGDHTSTILAQHWQEQSCNSTSQQCYACGPKRATVATSTKDKNKNKDLQNVENDTGLSNTTITLIVLGSLCAFASSVGGYAFRRHQKKQAALKAAGLKEVPLPDAPLF